MMIPWITSTAQVQMAAVTAAGPDARQQADGADQQQDHERGRQPVLGEQAQQLVVERRGGSRSPTSAGRAPSRTCWAVSRRALGRRPSRRRIALFAVCAHDFCDALSPLNRANSSKFLKTKL